MYQVIQSFLLLLFVLLQVFSQEDFQTKVFEGLKKLENKNSQLKNENIRLQILNHKWDQCSHRLGVLTEDINIWKKTLTEDVKNWRKTQTTAKYFEKYHC